MRTAPFRWEGRCCFVGVGYDNPSVTAFGRDTSLYTREA